MRPLSPMTGSRTQKKLPGLPLLVALERSSRPILPTSSTRAAEGQYPESITSKSLRRAFLRPAYNDATSSGVDLRPEKRL